MAPSAKKIEEAVVDGTVEIFSAEPDGTSVNKVRKHVEEKLGLESGFLSNSAWKQKSKTIIKEHVEKLLDGWTPGPKAEPETKNGVKRQSSEPESPEPKRQKRAAKPKNFKKEESNLSEPSEEESKPKSKKASADRKIKTVESDDEEATFKSSPTPEKKRKRKTEDESDQENHKVKDNDEEEEKTITVKRQPTENSQVKRQEEVEDTKDSIKVDESKPSIDEEDEYSDVIDEPMTKPKKKAKRESSGKPAKTASKPTKTAAASPDDPDEAEIKKLQSQLVKCGIRKLWHNELKKYGDDARAKIRHLRKMLADVGMEGRFSEAKAREIRETRELLAEAEAAQEMDALWGMTGGTRASRSKSKSMKPEDSGSGAEDDGPDVEADGASDDEEDNTFAARRRRAQADLAFLGDDSDEDSD